MKRRTYSGYESKFTKAQLGLIIFRLSAMLGEHIDAIFFASENGRVLTPEEAAVLAETQRDARFLSASFSPRSGSGVRL